MLQRKTEKGDGDLPEKATHDKGLKDVREPRGWV